MTTTTEKQQQALPVPSEMELARMFHDAYERNAKQVGWNTQGNCKVEFDDLPDKNKQTMLVTCRDVLAVWQQRQREVGE